MHPRTLIGRDRELDALRAGLDAATRGAGGLHLLIGEPGIGKTSLAGALAEAAREASVGAVWGRCWEAGGAPAFWPWTQALERLLGEAPELAPDAIADALRRAGPEVLRIVPAFAERAPDLPAAGPLDAESTRFAAGRALTTLLTSLSKNRPLVLILDDLHAADHASLHALRFVARALRALPILIVGTYRDVEARLTAETGELLAAVAREATVWSLGRLDAGDAAALIRRTSDVSAPVAAAIFAATQGNPLFVDEVVRLLAQQNGLGGDAAISVPVPFGVREAIRQRLLLVDDEARTFLEVAAIAGDAVRSDVIAAVLGMPQSVVEDGLARATRAGALLDLKEAQRFSHALFREVIDRDLPHSRRSELHKAVAAALLHLPVIPHVEVAHHLLAAGPEHVAAAIDAVERAQASLVQRGAYDDATALVERARAVLGQNIDGRLAGRLLVAHAEALTAAGRAREGKELSAQAAALAEKIGDAELLARAALGFGGTWKFGFVNQELVEMLEKARARLGDTHPRLLARVEARLAGAMQPAVKPAVPMALARAAIARARTTADDATILDALHTGMSALMDYEEPSARIPLNQELLERAMSAGDRGKELRAHIRLTFDLTELGDLAAMEDEIGRYERAADEVGHPQHRFITPLMRSMLALIRGADDEHARQLAAAKATAAQAAQGIGDATLAFHELSAAIVREDAPRIRAMRVVVERFLVGATPVGTNGMGAWVAHAAGDIAAAQRHLAALPVDIGATSPGDSFMLPALLASARAQAHAGPLYESMLQRKGMVASLGAVAFVAFAPYDRLLGLCAVALGRNDDARRHFDDAVTLCTRMGAEGFLPALARDLEGLGAAPSPSARARDADLTDVGFALSRDGDVWQVTSHAGTFRMKDSRGLQILHALVEKAGVEVLALDLVSSGAVDGGDAGELLDDDAKRAYRRRLRAIDEDLEEAEGAHDAARCERLLAEKQAIASELSRGLGLGGKARRAGGAAERARVAVQRRVKDAVEKIQALDPALGAHLEWAVKTGTYCVYRRR